MATLHVGKSLKDDDILWRYLSLDKFIDLVSSNTLFFAPLAWYERSDPFEGFMPHVAMDALASISRKFRDEQRDNMAAFVQRLPESSRPQLLKVAVEIEGHVTTMKAIHKNLANCLMVNCWYQSAHESEGMWSLYSRDGVAIRTTVGALRAALANDQPQPVVNIGAIKYLDFTDPALTARDCLSADGHLIGMIKRVAYAHEHEVRMFISPERMASDLSLHTPAAMRVPADARALLDAVVVSPFAAVTLEHSVRTVAAWAGLDAGKVSRSNLLDGCDHLLEVYQ